ncbi:hypothetical protein XENORESO_013368 [Xenotaenia resolanae]|uniref:Uncharacterized protein n=1 Tax=Xenotaenia resolanae TaxID=208358 RepID=A0ABV0VZ09_9TELE
MMDNLRNKPSHIFTELSSFTWFTVGGHRSIKTDINNKSDRQPGKLNNTGQLQNHFRLTRDQDDLREDDSSGSLLSVLSSVVLPRTSQFTQDLCLFISISGVEALLYRPQDTLLGPKTFTFGFRRYFNAAILNPIFNRTHLLTFE